MKVWGLIPVSAVGAGILTMAFLPQSVTLKKTARAVYRDCAICPEMVEISPGRFFMGSTLQERRWALEAGSQSDWLNNERPRHQVKIAYKFAVGKFEVTQAEWRAVMGKNPSYFKGDRNPVELVSWNDVQEYLSRLSHLSGKRYRLLTEREWEYCARANTETPFSTGETISVAQANFNGDYTYAGSEQGKYRGKTSPVGSFSSNGFDIHDMHGNVWEWTADCYGKDAYALRRTANHEPSMTSEGCHRVLRGGAFYNAPMNLRSAKRYWYYPVFRSGAIGFRVARDLQ